MSRILGWLIVVLIVASAGVRLAGGYDDFWLDEIWSYRIAAQVTRAWQILLDPVARFDNNHPLNTLFMWMVGRNPHWAVYRVPALVAGIGSVVLAATILRRRGQIDALVGVLLVGFSYPLVFYSSEARGYAPAVFFALLAWDAMDRHLLSRGWLSNLAFVVACVLGMLSHLTFIHVYAGLLAWSIYRWTRERTSPGVFLLNFVRFHLVPLATLAGLYLMFVRHLTIGGAPYQARLAAIRDALGGLLGAGDSADAAVVLIGIAMVLFAWSLVYLWRTGSDLWLPLVIVAIVSPLAVVGRQLLLVEWRQPISARYFLVPFTFLLLSVAMLLSAWVRRGAVARVVAGAVLAAFVGINLWHTMLFLRVGRGHYLDAVAYMSERTPMQYLTVLSDHPMRTAMVLDFYRPFLSPYQDLVIYDGSADPPLRLTHGPPLWLIVHSNERGRTPDQFAGYVFDREFPYYGLSGYSWYLYRHRGLP